MIISLFTGNRITANQLAKQHIIDALDARSCGMLDDTGDLTEKEQHDLMQAWEKQIARVAKLMGGHEKLYK